MFKFLKEKLSNWAKNISKKESEPEAEEKKPAKTEKKDTKKEQKKSESKEVKKVAKKEVVEEKAEKVQEEPEKEGFFSRLKSKISKSEVTEEEFEIYAEDLRMLLLENNVAFEAAERVISALREMIVGKELLKKEVEQYIRSSLRDIIEEMLPDSFDLISKIQSKGSEPFVIMFAGINGAGKTTTIAKVAHLLKKSDISCVMAAGDTFRAASIEQIKTHGARLKVPVISQQYGADPASVGFDAIAYAKKHNIQCVLIDTAGRMHTAKNLMKEAEKIAKICKPDLKIFIGESITGNDAVEQARAFNEAIGIDGIILAKADIDEKGGTALSVSFITKKPILFLGVGQEYKDLEVFDKVKFTERLGLA